MPPVCAYCGVSRGLPHRSDADCFRELDLEIAADVQRLRALTRRKGQLLRVRIQARQRAAAQHARRQSRPVSPFAARKFGRKQGRSE